MSNICLVEKCFKAAALVDLVLPRMLELNTIQADDAAGVMMSVLQVRELPCKLGYVINSERILLYFQ